MPRLTESVPKYRKHRASGQAFVELNGQRRYLGRHGTRASKVEYDRLVAEWLLNGRQPIVTRLELTIVEACARYWQHAKRLYINKAGKPTSELHGIKAALRCVKQLYGRTSAAKFSAAAVRAVRHQMVEAGLARSTINQNVSRIRRAFKWLAAEQLVPITVYQTLTVVDGLRSGRSEARETAPVLPVDDATVKSTLEYVPEIPADMVQLQRLTGMRPTEVCILRPMDVDCSSDVWTTYRPESHKTEHYGRERVILIGPQAQSIL
ncbi:MAG: hypothetical protein WD851_18600 [Pirellulales bacterium]